MAQTTKPILTLKEFMVRKQVINLYRDFLRTVREVPTVEDRKELTEWIRRDFKANKHHKDEYAIKSLIKYGERSLKELRQNLEFTR